MRELALFAGAGGGILGGYLNGWETVCAVEWEPYAAAVLVARQNDRCLPAFPVWDDIRTFDGRRWRGRVDVVSGGFPCQDISAAGKGAGIDGERSGMWREMARVIGEVEPGVVLVENSPLLVGRGLARVLGDLAQMGYDARWGIVGADDAGAPHRRKRIWLVAYATGERERSGACGAGGMGGEREQLHGSGPRGNAGDGGEDVAYAGCSGKVRRVDYIGIGEAIGASEAIPHAVRDGCEADHGGQSVCDRNGNGAEFEPGAGGDGEAIPHADGAVCEWEGPAQPAGREHAAESAGGGEDVPHANIFHGDGVGHGAGALCGERGIAAGGWWESEPALGRVADGVAHRVGQLRAIGNGQVAAVVRLAWEKLGSGNFKE